MIDKFTAADFKPYLNQPFTLKVDDQETLAVELIDVATVGAKPAVDEDRRWPFSVLFRGPQTPVLEQRTYCLEHEKMGSFEFFLVPVGPDKTGMRYEAVFN